MRRDMLALGFQTAQMTLDANLAGLSHQDSMNQPVQAGNCINWLAGHLLASRDGLKQILNVEAGPSLNEEEAKAYRQSSPPLRADEAAVCFQRLVEELRDASCAIVSNIQAMSEEDLDTLLDPKMFPGPVERPTVASLLTLFLFHEAYHSGQIGLGRRLLGKSSGLAI